MIQPVNSRISGTEPSIDSPRIACYSNCTFGQLASCFFIWCATEKQAIDRRKWRALSICCFLCKSNISVWTTEYRSIQRKFMPTSGGTGATSTESLLCIRQPVNNICASSTPHFVTSVCMLSALVASTVFFNHGTNRLQYLTDPRIYSKYSSLLLFYSPS